MTNKEIADAAGVSAATVARMKKRPGWPGDSDKEKLVQFIQSTKSRSGRPKKGEEKTVSQSDTDEITKLNIEYKQSQIAKNHAATRDGQLRTLREYRVKMVSGCSQAISIIFKTIKSFDLEQDQLKRLKKAIKEAEQHLKGVQSE